MMPSPAGSPHAPRRDPSILKSGGSFRRRLDPPAVTFNVENERDSDDEGQITFSAHPRGAHYRASPAPSPPRSRPSSLLVEDTVDSARLSHARSVEDSRIPSGSPIVDLKLRGLRKTAAILRKVSSAERLTRLKDKIMRGGGSRERSPVRDDTFSDDESQPLVSPAELVTSAGEPMARTPLGVDCEVDGSNSAELSPRSDLTELESPHAALDVLPERKGDEDRGGGERVLRQESDASLCNMVEPYNMRLLAHGASEGARALWRQDAMDSGPPWPWDEPDSPV